MLIFDQLKKSDPELRLLAVVVSGGLLALLGGLWWVQIVRANDYQENLESQSFRTVRIPAVRGKIFDRNGIALAENRPSFSVNLYLEDLRRAFDAAGRVEVARADAQRELVIAAKEKDLHRALTRPERRQFALSLAETAALKRGARYAVASNAVVQIGLRLHEPLVLDEARFQRHYETRLALPYPVVPDLTPVQLAQFEEQCATAPGADLEVQSTRFYPHGTTAAHLLGELHRDDSSIEGEDAFFSYRLPDFQGVIGIEFGCDKELHGRAGAKSVLVNSLGYRQSENTWSPAEPGHNVVLTIDLRIQQAAERALPVYGPATRGAAVVMDVQTGDVLALVSSPTFNPNHFVQGFPTGEWQRVQSQSAEKNRATYEHYAPGSIFKPLVGLACLEAGLDPKATINNPGFIYVGRRLIHDLATPGIYDFRRAIMFSSNTYFITNGLKAGIENIVKLGQQLHFGERIGLQTRQESAGVFPSLKRVHSNWFDGDTANVCIGQGEIEVTPLQMAVMTAALANGGKVLWPRFVDRIEPQDPASDEPPNVFPKGRVRDQLEVSRRSLQILQDAMRDEVEDAGTGARALVPGLRICGKTGTAQIMDTHNRKIGDTTWFISFAPYEKPRYAVVVMVESGSSGGLTCAPIAAPIYQAILQRERANPAAAMTMAQVHY